MGRELAPVEPEDAAQPRFPQVGVHDDDGGGRKIIGDLKYPPEGLSFARRASKARQHGRNRLVKTPRVGVHFMGDQDGLEAALILGVFMDDLPRSVGRAAVRIDDDALVFGEELGQPQADGPQNMGDGLFIVIAGNPHQDIGFFDGSNPPDGFRSENFVSLHQRQ